MKTLTPKEKSERAKRAVDTRKKWLAGTDARAAWVTRKKDVPQSKHGVRVFPSLTSLPKVTGNIPSMAFVLLWYHLKGWRLIVGRKRTTQVYHARMPKVFSY
jgi:hypothetical protein